MGAFLILLGCLYAQSAAEIQQALTGSWVGTLEYRDFSEPGSSTKRVKLPTWLRVEPAGGDLRFRYIYDDGPAKTVTETSLVRIDWGAARYIVLDEAGKVESNYTIAGLDQLRAGRGILTLAGKGIENDAPVDVRSTLRIGRNILEITRETAAGGQPYTFRHAYTFVRSAAPSAPI
ncbi:MAG: hypothetical protein ABSH50_19990 [Bryobacteraceae bacterium]|jgi:hypothetical protein